MVNLRDKKTNIYKIRVVVYIDSLVMISIERSETNEKRALEIQDKIFGKGIFFHNFSIKHDILRLFAKKEKFGENFLSPTLSWTLSWIENFLSPKFF